MSAQQKDLLTKRKRVELAINHKEPDSLPVDIGGTLLTGIHVSNVYKLRQHYGIDSPGTPVKAISPCGMQGEVALDLKEIMGADVVSPKPDYTTFGYPQIDFKKWKLDDGTPVLVPKLFNTKKNPDGSIYQYPKGDITLPPSGHMPKGGYYFDAIIRKKDVDDAKLDPKYNLEEYTIMQEGDLNTLYKKVKDMYNTSSYAISIGLPGTSFGDIFTIPGISLEDPKGIRDIEEWYISLHTRKDYIKRMFSAQLEIGLSNLKKLIDKLKDMVQVVIISATDFSAQNGLFVSLDTYRELFKPYHKVLNDYIHTHTNWKTFIHTCGAVYELIPDLIDSGFDILNPVQISANGMDPKKLKDEYGKDITFWGGGIDTQKTLPLGTPKEVKEEAKKLIDIFSPGGGFIFAAVHNIQANVPVENIVAIIEVIQDYKK